MHSESQLDFMWVGSALLIFGKWIFVCVYVCVCVCVWGCVWSSSNTRTVWQRKTFVFQMTVPIENGHNLYGPMPTIHGLISFSLFLIHSHYTFYLCRIYHPDTDKIKCTILIQTNTVKRKEMEKATHSKMKIENVHLARTTVRSSLLQCECES